MRLMRWILCSASPLLLSCAPICQPVRDLLFQGEADDAQIQEGLMRATQALTSGEGTCLECVCKEAVRLNEQFWRLPRSGEDRWAVTILTLLTRAASVCPKNLGPGLLLRVYEGDGTMYQGSPRYSVTLYCPEAGEIAGGIPNVLVDDLLAPTPLRLPWPANCTGDVHWRYRVEADPYTCYSQSQGLPDLRHPRHFTNKTTDFPITLRCREPAHGR